MLLYTISYNYVACFLQCLVMIKFFSSAAKSCHRFHRLWSIMCVCMWGICMSLILVSHKAVRNSTEVWDVRKFECTDRMSISWVTYRYMGIQVYIFINWWLGCTLVHVLWLKSSSMCEFEECSKTYRSVHLRTHRFYASRLHALVIMMQLVVEVW